MFKNLWVKMKGVESRPEIQATIRTVSQFEEPSSRRYEVPRKLAEITFAYIDTRQEHQYGSITVADSSLLYDAKEDDTFMIRVNPTHPDRYYSTEATTSYL